MAKTYLLNDTDRRRLAALLAEAERNGRTVHPVGRRVRGVPAGGSGGSRLSVAYCAEDAPAGRVIDCWLTHPEIVVTPWDATTVFAANALVWHDSEVWLSLSADNEANEPDDESEDWERVEEYDRTVTYTTGKWVWYQAKLYRALQSATDVLPSNATYWSSHAPAYASGTSYVTGARVTSGGKLWRALTGESNQGYTPGAEGSEAYWAEIESIEVWCNIANGSKLQFAFPLLHEQVPLRIERVGNRYECIDLFQAAEETAAAGGMLDVVTNELLEEVVCESPNGYELTYITASDMGLTIPAKPDSTYTIEGSIIYTTTGDGVMVGVIAEGTGDIDFVEAIYTGVDGAATASKTCRGYNTSYSGTTVVTFEPTTTTGYHFIHFRIVAKTDTYLGEITIAVGCSSTTGSSIIKDGSTIKWRRQNFVYHPTDPE
jgi:hypothetical protein